MSFLDFTGLKYFYNKYIKPIKPHAKEETIKTYTVNEQGHVPDAQLVAQLKEENESMQAEVQALNSALAGKQDKPQKMMYYWITDETEVDSAIKSTAEYYFKNNMENDTCFNIYLSLKKGNTYRIDGLKVDNTYGYMQISSYALSKPYYGTASGGGWTWS